VKQLFQVVIVLLRWSRSIEGSGRVTFGVIATGALAGLGSSALIAVVNTALSKQPSKALAMAFVPVCLAISVCGFISEALLIKMTSQIVYNLQLQLSRQILGAPYRLLEELGAHRLLATLTDDIGAVSSAITNFPLLFIQCVIMAGCLIYLGWLSLPLLLVLLAYMCVGVIAYHLPLQHSVKYFQLMRGERDVFFHHIRLLIEGIKELKLNKHRRNGFLSRQLEPSAKNLQNYSNKANYLSVAASHWGQGLFLLFIGSIVFLAPLLATIDRRALTGYAFTILFMISPLATILNLMPVFARASVAADKIERLGLSLSNCAAETAPAAEVSASWATLNLVGVTHVYRHDGNVNDFYLGPLDLTFVPGELVFLIGGNGSGKTTLAKLIVGLYEPLKGTIQLDGEIITMANRDWYRQHFAVVFFDFHLFDYIYGTSDEELAAKASKYLDQLRLSDKVQIEGNKLSTIDLSQGQCKRLALLLAYFEDRPIYVFDEWASDQDPVFKEIFYHQILPELKARGKTVIVISHDDRYYHIADRLIKLEFGMLDPEGSSGMRQQQEVTAPVL